jgi:hypothetical protein
MWCVPAMNWEKVGAETMHEHEVYGAADGLRYSPSELPGAAKARKIIGGCVCHHTNEHIHFAIDYFSPADCLAGQHLVIVAERDRLPESARERRAECRHEARYAGRPLTSSPEPLDSHS